MHVGLESKWKAINNFECASVRCQDCALAAKADFGLCARKGWLVIHAAWVPLTLWNSLLHGVDSVELRVRSDIGLRTIGKLPPGCDDPFPRSR
jgi:hypothetical protein